MPADVRKKIRQFLERLISHEAQRVIVASTRLGEGTEPGALDDQGSDWLVVESVPEWDALAAELPAAFPIQRLRGRIAEGCFVLLLHRPAPPGPARQFVGYRLCERGIFSSLGLRARTSPDLVFIHHAEVLPEFRGQRIAMTLLECSLRDGRRRNIAWVCGVVSTTNAASLASHLRARPGRTLIVVGTVHRIDCLGGRFMWRTPWRTIEQALNRLA